MGNFVEKLYIYIYIYIHESKDMKLVAVWLQARLEWRGGTDHSAYIPLTSLRYCFPFWSLDPLGPFCYVEGDDCDDQYEEKKKKEEKRRRSKEISSRRNMNIPAVTEA